jgi:hypothetical protein
LSPPATLRERTAAAPEESARTPKSCADLLVRRRDPGLGRCNVALSTGTPGDGRANLIDVIGVSHDSGHPSHGTQWWGPRRLS